MTTLTWQAPEFEYHAKSTQWFIALWIIAAGLVAVAIITKSFFMAALVVIGAFIFHLYAVKYPRTLTISVDPKVLRIENKEYPLERFSSFWIFERQGRNYLLSLAPKKSLQMHIALLIPEEHVPRARMLLRPTLPEVEHEESIIDTLADRIRF